MGGDGGVIASNRKYMRGAGTADKTGDLNRHAAQKFSAQEVMATCALTKSPLYTTTVASGASSIVADPYGCLYHKEAAVQALLTRKQQHGTGNSSASNNTIGPQVRRLADLYEVRFYREEHRIHGDPTCPISGKALTGSIPAILLVPGKDGISNVVSESGLAQISPEELEAEYGLIRKRVRLAPNLVLLEKIKEHVQQEQDKEDEERRKAKKDNKSKRKRDGKGKRNNISSDKKKRKADKNDDKNTELSRSSNNNRNIKASLSSIGKEVQSRVDSAIQQNSVLSSLFTNKSALSKLTEKEKKDNLFAR